MKGKNAKHQKRLDSVKKQGFDDAARFPMPRTRDSFANSKEYQSYLEGWNERHAVQDNPKKHTKRVKRAKRVTRAPRKKAAKKSRRVNPRPMMFIITAKKGAGKKMHFDGKNFSQRARISTFKTMQAAETKAQDLLARFPILRRYRVCVESNRPPNF